MTKLVACDYFHSSELGFVIETEMTLPDVGQLFVIGSIIVHTY